MQDIFFFTVSADIEWICFPILVATWTLGCCRLTVISWPCNLQRLRYCLHCSHLQQQCWWWRRDGMVWLWFEWTVGCERVWLCAAMGFLIIATAKLHVIYRLPTLQSHSISLVKSHTCWQQCSIHVKQRYSQPFCYFSLWERIFNCCCLSVVYHCTLSKALI